MLLAGSGAAVHADGVHAATEASRKALVAAGATAADMALVFAGVAHAGDEFAAVLSAVARTTRASQIAGCSTTGVITGAGELEDARSVAVLVLSGADLPILLSASGINEDPRQAGRLLAEQARAALTGGTEGGMLCLLVDPGDLDATDLLASLQAEAPDLALAGAGAPGGPNGARVFSNGSAHSHAAVGILIPQRLHPTASLTQGCQPLGDPFTITAVSGNLVLELDGAPPVEALEHTFADPRNRGLARAAGQLLVGLSELEASGRGDWVVRPMALVDHEGGRVIAVPEPVRRGHTLRFTLRDAIEAREDVKAMLAEQEQNRNGHPPRFGFYFNCAGRGSALYGSSGLDPELIRKRFGTLQLIGLESSFEIGLCAGKPRVHMFTGVLVLAG